MARVKIEYILDQLDREMRRALRAAALEAMPNSVVDERLLFRAFKRALSRNCNTWETVPDDCVEKD